MDVTENLFKGLDSGDAKAEVRNLAAWRRLNEFKSDI